jgi:hypothetical protein
MMNRCPSPQQLQQLIDEQLAEAEHRRISLHVGNCPDCQATLDRLTEAQA